MNCDIIFKNSTYFLFALEYKNTARPAITATMNIRITTAASETPTEMATEDPVETKSTTMMQMAASSVVAQQKLLVCIMIKIEQ